MIDFYQRNSIWRELWRRHATKFLANERIRYFTHRYDFATRNYDFFNRWKKQLGFLHAFENVLTGYVCVSSLCLMYILDFLLSRICYFRRAEFYGQHKFLEKYRKRYSNFSNIFLGHLCCLKCNRITIRDISR